MAKAYKVERKDARVRFRPGTGEQYTVWRIWATSAGGTIFPLEIDEADIDKADALLTAHAQKLDAIK